MELARGRHAPRHPRLVAQSADDDGRDRRAASNEPLRDHEATIQRMLRPLLGILPRAWDLRIQSAITLSDSQPEPDFAIVRGSCKDYEARHPEPRNIGLLIEVA